MQKIRLCGLTLEEISALVTGAGFSSSHALRISNSLYKKSISSFSQAGDIPVRLIDYLDRIASTGLTPPVVAVRSEDKTAKYVFNDAGMKFETVFIPDGKRNTVCVSSQSGCRMGCPFCATGRYGYHGNLSAGQIVNQVLAIPAAREVNHVVFMGMGEPMDNLDNVLAACKILTAEWGMSLSPRNITVSSVGITPGIEKFLDSSECNLTVSLFSPFADERKKTVPAENKYPVREIITLLKKHNLKKNRRISLSYVMISGQNDSDDHLDELKRLLGGSDLRVNLLPYHRIGDEDFVSSSIERMNYFKHNLVVSGISASIRKSRGSDISAACGLLAGNLR